MSQATLSPAAAVPVFTATWDLLPVGDVPERQELAQDKHDCADSSSCHYEYFRETSEQRRERLRANKADRVADRTFRERELLADDDREGLFDLYYELLPYFAYRLQVKFEFDDSTKDDLIQAGSIALWNTCQGYDVKRKVLFSTYAFTVIWRAMWKEFDTLKRQQKRGFRQLSQERTGAVEYDRPEYLHEMAETEMIGVVNRKLLELPENARVILQQCCKDGETRTTLAKAFGVSASLIHRRYYWALEQMREMLLPMIVGAWHPSPCFLRDVWADIENARKQYSRAIPPEESHTCKDCGADLPNRRANFCDRNCANRFRKAQKRKAT